MKSSDLSKQSASTAGGRTELLAASHFYLSTPGLSAFSFTQSIMAALQALAQNGGIFSVADLYRGALQHIAQTSHLQESVQGRDANGIRDALIERNLPSPVHVRLDGHSKRPNIPLRAFNKDLKDAYFETEAYRKRAQKRSSLRFKATIPRSIHKWFFPPQLVLEDISRHESQISDEQYGASFITAASEIPDGQITAYPLECDAGATLDSW